MTSKREIVLASLEKMLTAEDLDRRAVSIVELAKRSGVSRVSIYKTCPEAIEKIKSIRKGNEAEPQKTASLKIDVLRSQLRKKAELIDALTAACEGLLNELANTQETMQELLERKQLRIDYLEKQLDGFRSKLIGMKR
ncbi:hypothetical protein F3G89_31185 [Pseudomonas aeruginosa]|uniref:hypothetical protein n=1 Tax=Pseudomonas aeruginosa TaxID=287 RepID=UPI00070F0A51|nr:hypothetical protein [Pseudomonas aeruginosa]KAA5622715.1 hypothetical protein F3G89_31185 [Pseudomonas aeruginosa]MBI7196579.1 hypothetical protein [Pseudomonas aeruginosa]MBX6272954.1 hypothetical protein [Pseudomonas aeruginosa]WBM19993.1 hypothetical protein M2J78_28890 [Pseudomonas aeruginosa]